MATTMVERVVSRMEDPRIAAGEFLFQPQLVERASVGKAVDARASRRPGNSIPRQEST
jgi:hypothetical protein